MSETPRFAGLRKIGEKAVQGLSQAGSYAWDKTAGQPYVRWYPTALIVGAATQIGQTLLLSRFSRIKEWVKERLFDSGKDVPQNPEQLDMRLREVDREVFNFEHPTLSQRLGNALLGGLAIASGIASGVFMSKGIRSLRSGQYKDNLADVTVADAIIKGVQDPVNALLGGSREILLDVSDKISVEIEKALAAKDKPFAELPTEEKEAILRNVFFSVTPLKNISQAIDEASTLPAQQRVKQYAQIMRDVFQRSGAYVGPYLQEAIEATDVATRGMEMNNVDKVAGAAGGLLAAVSYLQGQSSIYAEKKSELANLKQAQALQNIIDLQRP